MRLHMPTLVKNKRAHFDYEILDKLEAGLVLTGQEVKSIRLGNAKLTGAYVTIHNGSAWLLNARVSPYAFASNIDAYDPEQSRKLLLKSKEIEYLREKSAQDGLTIVPISLYTKGRHIKLEIGLAKGKKKYDKRDSIKKKDIERDIKRDIARYNK